MKTCAFEQCGEPFVGKRSDARYCSSKCQIKAWCERKPGRRESERARGRAHYYADVEKSRERCRVYYREHTAAHAAAVNRWQTSHPDEFKAIVARRRARKRGAAGSHTAAEWRAIVAKQHGRCVHCHAKTKLTRDHIVPISLGGTDYAYNLQGLCGPCNKSKHAKLLDYAHPSLFDRSAA